jgi:uncharacterized membrane protein
VEPRKKQACMRVAGLSALAGMRSMSGPALLSLDRRLISENSPAGKFFRSPYVLLGANVLALGEMFADKLPFVPKRTSFPALCARALSGAVIGASLYSVEELSPTEGALVGGVSAVAATYISYHVRRTLTKTFHVPDFLVALVEDSLVVGRGMKILERQLPSLELDADKIDAQAPGHHGMMHS